VRLDRVPIRLRVVAAFAVAMAVVLAAAGILVRARVGDDLQRALDTDLRLRAQDVTALIARPGGNLGAAAGGRLIEHGESYAQVLDQDGRVLDATPPLEAHPLLSPAEVEAAARAPLFADRGAIPGLDEGSRLLATAARRGGRDVVLVVGATRENGAETLRSLTGRLLVFGPLALVLAVALGYVLAGSGLRAVDAMRRRAEAISAERPGERLPVPATGDELERLGRSLNGMLDRLEQAIERERGFVAEAGHELRTPLSLLRGELDLALRHAGSEDELRAALRTASDETDRLVQMAGDLLLIARTDRGELPLHPEPLDARALLDSVRNRFAWRADDAGRDIAVDVAAPVTVEGDRIALEQALGNLVDNALRHGDGPVTLSARRAGAGVELHVADEGPGVPAAFAARAFDRFSRPDASAAAPGSGLGLAIVRAVARAHGGEAGLAERPGGGTDVRVALPAGAQAPGLRRPVARAAPPGG
jgi:two-component system OmpR family sensor kinase